VIKKRRYVERLVHPGRLLDVGCATGDFLVEMNRHGWDTVGIEPNERAAQLAQERGCRVMVGTLEHAQFGADSFDVITMWHVLEHVSDPLEQLAAAKRILKSKGLLIFCVPNLHSLEAKIFGHLWAGFDVPRHAYAFSRKGLKSLFDQTGFTPVETRSFFGGFNSLCFSLQFLLDDKCGNVPLRNVVLNIAQSFFSQCLLLPLLRAVDVLGQGSIITYVLTK
jgi:SAM-dependent methyltransferase